MVGLAVGGLRGRAVGGLRGRRVVALDHAVALVLHHEVVDVAPGGAVKESLPRERGDVAHRVVGETLGVLGSSADHGGVMRIDSRSEPAHAVVGELVEWLGQWIAVVPPLGGDLARELRRGGGYPVGRLVVGHEFRELRALDFRRPGLYDVYHLPRLQ